MGGLREPGVLGRATARRSAPSCLRRGGALPGVARARVGGAPGGSRTGYPVDGDHLHRVYRSRQYRPALALRRDPACDIHPGVGADLAGARPTLDGPQPLHRRPLRAGPGGGRRRVPGRAPGLVGQLPAPVPGRPAAPGRLGPHLRLRPRARRGRHHVRARGQPARAVRRLVHAREPPGHQAGVRRPVPGSRHPAGGRLPKQTGRHVGQPVAPPGRDARYRRAHTGGLQLRLLRACLPGPADGRPPRGGQGPRRRRRLRVPAHHRWARSRRRGLPPGRRLVPRPRGVQA